MKKVAGILLPLEMGMSLNASNHAHSEKRAIIPGG